MTNRGLTTRWAAYCALSVVGTLIIGFAWSLIVGAAPPEQAPTQHPFQELRGVWSGYKVSPDWPTAMRRLHEANFNAVFPYVCSAGVAYYPSKVLPVSPTTQGTNYLAVAVAAGHEYGVSVHARILALELLFSSEAVKAQMEQDQRLMLTARGQTVPWLCPSDPRNRRLLTEVAVELAQNYAIDGLQFDYLRYPWRDSCVGPRCRQQFIRDTGVQVEKWPEDVVSGPHAEAFSQWRQAHLTRLLAEIVAAVRAVRPDIVISAAVFPRWEQHSRNFGQDAQAWVEQGLIDFVCPMNYTNDLLDLAAWVLEQQEQVAGKVPLIVGLGPFSDAGQFTGPQQLVDQIRIARAFGASGFVVFKYNDQFANDYLPYLAQTVTATPAHPERHNPSGQQTETNGR